MTEEMITKPNMIYYASISKGTTVVAEFNSQDAELAALAERCLEKTPQLHATFSHTIWKRTYTFLIDDHFVYFAIHNEVLENSESLGFLRRVKEAFEETVGVVAREKLTSHCFQGEFSPIFHRLLSLADMEFPRSPPRASSSHNRNRSLDSSSGKQTGSVPLLGGTRGDQSKALKKKQRHNVEEHCHGHGGSPEDMGNSNSLSSDGVVLTRDVTNQRAKKVWKKHVWVVLSLDLLVCFILFAIWLWVCKGFKCINE